jgi:hypothetical protein
MKIIATTNSGYICEVSHREISLLGSSNVSIGDEIGLERAYDTIANLRSISRTNLAYLGDQINKLSKKYEEVADMYDKTMMLDTVKNSEGR